MTMISAKAVKRATWRRAVSVSIIMAVCMTLMWPQVTYDLLVMRDADLIRYKYQGNRTQFLCVDMKGRLGNLLFQYAFAYSMAKQHNHTLVCDAIEMLKIQELFDVPDCPRHSLGRKVCYSQFKTQLTINTGYDKAIEKVDFSRDVHFGGFVQSWKYWGKYENDIRKQYIIREDTNRKANEILQIEIRKLGYRNISEVTLVGVHIRRGDLMKEFFDFGYNVVTEEYILKAKKYMEEHVKGPIVYVVCSNDIKWSREVMWNSVSLFFEGNSRELDFAVLASCDHFIMSVGTFGWWIGWHIKGIVTYYTKPFRPDTGLAHVFANDYLTSFFYPGWVGLS